jgi:hypothetical protein
MSNDMASVTKELEDQVPFGRNRLLKGFGLFLFGSVLSASKAAASCSGGGGSPCYGLSTCSSCSGATCTVPGCTSNSHLGCTGTKSCWTTCVSKQLWICCDYTNSSGNCLCGAVIDPC